MKDDTVHLEPDEQTAQRKRGSDIEADGVAALYRLYEVAQGDSGQCRHVAAFLAGCYNGPRFPFDLTRLRALDTGLWQDCMAVLAMDRQPFQEVHQYFEDGRDKWETMIKRWALDGQ